MAKTEVDKVTEEKLSHGGVLVKLYFDMRHTDKDKLQPLMADLINERLMKESGIVYCYGAIEEPIERDGVYTTGAMITVLVDRFMPLVEIALKYAPAGIEILKPNELHMKSAELQSLLMNLSDKSMTYSRYLLENVMKPEDVKGMLTHIEDRAQLGKKLLDQRKKQGDA